MYEKPPIKGLGLALVTPFNSKGQVDYPALRSLVYHSIARDVDFLVALGTTGEAPTLTQVEQEQIVRLIVDEAGSDFPIVVGLSGNNTTALIKRILDFSLDGVDAILSAVPSYNKPSQEGIYQHFMALNAITPLPIILYNVPGRTGTNMLPETTLRIARDCKKVIAIKEASGNLDQVAHIIANKPDNFTVLSGDDSLTLPMIALGAEGVISVIGNALPVQFARVVHKALKGDFKAAQQAHYLLQPLYSLLFAEGNPAGVKALLDLLQLTPEHLRLPLTPVSDSLKARIKAVLDKIPPED